MTEPNTPNKALIIPNTGDLPGAWGTAALNPDFTAIDGMFGGAQTISLSSATTFALSAPSGSITAGAGPNQAQNAILKFTGTLSGNAVITFPLPGYYILNNQCTVGSFYIQCRASGTGGLIGIPPGKQSKVWCDGTDMGFCDTPEVGSYLDLAASTTPGWFAACSTAPWLVCDGTSYFISSYPFLGKMLGSTFGGDGVTSFNVPDVQNRVLVPKGSGTGIRLNSSGVSGGTVGSAGGNEQLQAHNHGVNFNDPGHLHGNGFQSDGTGLQTAVNGVQFQLGGHNTGSSTTGITVSINTTGNGGSLNVQPTIVGGIKLIKT